MIYLEQPLKLYEVHSETLQISQNRILKNIQVIHRKAGKRNQGSEKQQTKQNKK